MNPIRLRALAPALAALAFAGCDGCGEVPVVTLCDGVTCGANAACDQATGACACSPGFQGDPAAGCTAAEHCAADSCGSHGRCDDTSGKVVCACDEGFAGPACAGCATDYDLDASGKCLHEKKVACAPPATIPEHGHAVEGEVTVTFTTAAGWSAPPACAVACDTDYDLDVSGKCLHEKKVACAPPATVPEHGHAVEGEVTVTFTTAAGWSAPAACAVACDTDYDLDASGKCLHEKQVPCATPLAIPEHAHAVAGEVPVFFTSDEGWSEPDFCEIACDLDHAMEGGVCLHEKPASCAPAQQPPEHAHPTNPVVTVVYSTTAGWSEPEACAYACDADHEADAAGKCIHEKLVACRDAAPEHATSKPGQVTVTFTTGAGWSAASDCEWSCDAWFHQEGSGCVADVLSVSCVDALAADPAAASGKYPIDPDGPGPLAGREVFCDMTRGGLTFLAGESAGADWAEISKACPSGFVPFAVRNLAGAQALEAFVKAQSSGDWFWANFFAGPARDCGGGLAPKTGWLADEATWVDALIAPSALPALDIAGNCNNANVFDPIPISRSGGIQNREATGYVYNSTEKQLPGTVVCSLPAPTYRPGKFLVFELFDHYPGGMSDGATLTEVKLFDRAGAEVAFTATGAYDSPTGGLPAYWNSGIWGKANLNDGETRYLDNGTGAQSTAIFVYPSGPNSGAWGRFAIELPKVTDLSKVKIWAGSPEGRVPHHIKVWAAQVYQPSMVSTRAEDGMALLGTLLFKGTEASVGEYDLAVPPSACFDGIKDGDESDVDCGGSCGPCAAGEACGGPGDCLSGGCCGEVCVDLLGDEANCGGCGVACGAEATCRNGYCGVERGLVLDLNASRATGTGFPAAGCGADALAWADLSSSALTGALQGFAAAQCTSASTGWQGDGSCGSPHRLVFDGANDSVSFPNTGGVFNLTAGVTVEVWVNARSLASDPVLVSTMESPGYHGFYMEIWKSKLIFSTTGNTWFWGNATLQPNTWYHLAATDDGTTKRLFVNGALDGEQASVSLSNPVGGLLLGTWSAGGFMLDGSISRAKVYGRALSAAEVKANYDAGKAAFVCP